MPPTEEEKRAGQQRAALRSKRISDAPPLLQCILLSPTRLKNVAQNNGMECVCVCVSVLHEPMWTFPAREDRASVQTLQWHFRPLWRGIAYLNISGSAMSVLLRHNPR